MSSLFDVSGVDGGRDKYRVGLRTGLVWMEHSHHSVFTGFYFVSVSVIFIFVACMLTAQVVYFNSDDSSDNGKDEFESFQWHKQTICASTSLLTICVGPLSPFSNNLMELLLAILWLAFKAGVYSI